jgi:hypothetical protein
MIREMSRFLRYGSIAVELNPVRQKAQLLRPPESGGPWPASDRRLGLITPGACMPRFVAAHVGERNAATAALEEKTADLDGKISVQAHSVADLDRRVSQIDSAIEVAVGRGKTNTALSTMEAQRRCRTALVDEWKREAGKPTSSRLWGR